MYNINVQCNFWLVNFYLSFVLKNNNYFRSNICTFKCVRILLDLSLAFAFLLNGISLAKKLTKKQASIRKYLQKISLGTIFKTR